MSIEQSQMEPRGASARWRKSLSDLTATLQLGAALALCCPLPTVVYLEGELGSGKTTLVRGFLNALGYSGRVKSPTYTLLESYELDRCSVYHFDLYRLAAPEEFEYLGASDYLNERAVWLIEWPQRGGNWLPAEGLGVRLEYAGDGRVATLRPRSRVWKRALQKALG